MLDIFKRHVRSHTRIALVGYDALATDPNQIRNLLAYTHDNRKARENPVSLVEDFISVSATGWEDELVVSGSIDELQYTVPVKGYSAAVPYNEINMDRPGALVTLPQIIAKLPEALVLKQVQLIMNVFRNSPLTADGQNFFADAHVHINGKAYDNTITYLASNASNITFDEGKRILHLAMARLATNQAMQAEVVNSAELQSNVVVIAHNAQHFGVFEEIRTQSSRNNVENELKGKFTLLLDLAPTAGQENRLEVVYSKPNGPRPAFYVPDTSPWLDVWKDNIRNGYVAVGMKEIFGVKPAHAHTTVQVTVNNA